MSHSQINPTRASGNRASDKERVAVGLHRVVVAWGLWHSGKKKWLTWPLSSQERTYETQGEAAAAKIQMTRGKRDVMTNYFRIAVKVRRFQSHNSEPSRAGD